MIRIARGSGFNPTRDRILSPDEIGRKMAPDDAQAQDRLRLTTRLATGRYTEIAHLRAIIHPASGTKGAGVQK
ncbi:MAG: hypothetical protein ACREV5_21450 [Steroidobacter sp.]